VLFSIFIVIPAVSTALFSFYDWNLLGSRSPGGLVNYRKLADDHAALQALRNTFIFTFASIVTHVGGGLALALAVNRRMSAATRYFLRTAFFFPFLISWAAVALIWQYALDPTFGLATFYGHKIGLPSNWLLSTKLALPALIGVDLWHTIGFAFIVILAGVLTVPTDLYEAAAVDGASAWRRFWHITLPGASNSLFFVSVISFIGAFQIFEPMYLMTRGGPAGSTESTVQYLYETAFRNFDLGYGSALALVVFTIILMATLFQFTVVRKLVRDT
jgi:multiple sugar transport system permease protein